MLDTVISKRRRRVYIFVFFVLLSFSANFWADEISYLDVGFDQEPFQVWKVVCMNIAIVFFYATAIWCACYVDQKNGLSPDHEKWADSIYFLGFIITLMALIMALTKIDGAGGPEALISTVHQNGAALSSTVIALIIRTIWNLSLSQKADDLFLSDRMKQSIETAAAALAASFETMSSSVSSADASFFASVKGVLASFQKVGNELDKIDLSNKRVGNEVGKALGTALHDASEQSTRLKGKLEDLGKSTSLTEGEFKSLDERLRATDESLRVLGEKLRKSTDADIGLIRKILRKIF